MDKTVAKAFRLLELLTHSGKPMGVTELADAAGLGKSNAHRLLQTLLELGYVRPSNDGSYEPTLLLWEMGNRVLRRLSLRDVARPYMIELSELTSETVHLSSLDGFEVLYIDKIDSSEPVMAYTQIGARAPAYCTATGKAMIAYRSEPDIAKCISKAHQFTPKTITSLDKFLDEARAIQSHRFAINVGEWRADIMGAASAILDSSGTTVGAIGISGPASRLTKRGLVSIAQKIVSAAERISLSLGCSEGDWAMLGEKTAPPRRQMKNKQVSKR